MRRTPRALAGAAALAAVALAVGAPAAHAPGIAPPRGERAAIGLALVIENGRVAPAVSTVRKGSRLALSVVNHDPRPVRFELTGYEERVAAPRIAPDSGYRVVFVPFENGKPRGPYETFAEGFWHADQNVTQHRPVGVAQGPDGSLYITDDAAGRIWRVMYRGR